MKPIVKAEGVSSPTCYRYGETGYIKSACPHFQQTEAGKKAAQVAGFNELDINEVYKINDD